jgi:hypothetical protein
MYTLITNILTTVIQLTDIIQAHTTIIIIMALIRIGYIEGALIITDTPLVLAGTAIADITGDDMVFAMCQ